MLKCKCKLADVSQGGERKAIKRRKRKAADAKIGRGERKAVCCQRTLGCELSHLIDNGIIEKETTRMGRITPFINFVNIYYCRREYKL